MGSYTHKITNSEFFIPKENFEEAFNAVCELNNDNSIKRGGHWPIAEGDENVKGPHPKYWFSWMDWNYTETCETIVEVFEQLGFDVHENDEGIISIWYDNPIGQEELFLQAIVPYVQDGSYLDWQTDDGCLYRHIYENGEMVKKEGRVVWD